MKEKREMSVRLEGACAGMVGSSACWSVLVFRSAEMESGWKQKGSICYIGVFTQKHARKKHLLKMAGLRMSQKGNHVCQISPLLPLSPAVWHQGEPFSSGLLLSWCFRALSGSCRVSESSGSFPCLWGWALCLQALSTPGFSASYGPLCSFQKVLAGLLQPLAGTDPLPTAAFPNPHLPLAAWHWWGLGCHSRIVRNVRFYGRRKVY